jgi:hypothetical protein
MVVKCIISNLRLSQMKATKLQSRALVPWDYHYSPRGRRMVPPSMTQLNTLLFCPKGRRHHLGMGASSCSPSYPGSGSSFNAVAPGIEFSACNCLSILPVPCSCATFRSNSSCSTFSVSINFSSAAFSLRTLLSFFCSVLVN